MVYRLLKKIILILIISVVFFHLFTSPWFLKKLYPYPHRELIEENCFKNKVDPFFVLALIKTESRFYVQAHSRAGARGLMQIMPETGQWIARQMGLTDFKTAQLFEPDYNIALGIWYLTYLLEQFEEDLVKTVAAYNAGINRVNKWLVEGLWSGELADLEQIPYQETRKYVQRVFFNYQVYKYVYL